MTRSTHDRGYKVGRNELCPCGSGLKYKKCCINGPRPAEMPPGNAESPGMKRRERHRAEERLRQAQQGHGRPIVAVDRGGQQVVTVGTKVFHSSKWKTFQDFLAAYLQDTLTPEWGNAELAKPIADRHQVL